MLLFEAVLLMLFIKHWICDFVWQTPDMIAAKGKYGAWKGVVHSSHHAVLTFVIFIAAGVRFALMMALLDFILHYHIDYVKVKYGESNMASSRFWKHFGLDQLAHYVTYLIIVSIFVRTVQ
jgi:hypothetical protein